MTEHQLVEVEHYVVDAPERVINSAVQGPPKFVRCSCGWTAHAEDVNIYEATGQHMSKALA